MSYISNPLYGEGGGSYPTLTNTSTGLLNDGDFDNTGILTADNYYPQTPNTTYLNCNITTDDNGYIQIVEDGNVGELFTSGAYAIPTTIASGQVEEISNQLELDEGFYAITQEVTFSPATNGTTEVLQVFVTLGVYNGATLIKNYINNIIMNGNTSGQYPNTSGQYIISTFLNVPNGLTYTLNTDMGYTGAGSSVKGSAVINAFRLR